MNSRKIPLRMIRSSDQPRQLNASAVDALARSLEQIGLMQPITVIQSKISAGIICDGYRIVAGHHRFAAASKLNWEEIDAIVIDEAIGHLTAELMEIDENLCRAELTNAQRTVATKRRKQIWEALHPKVKSAAGAADFDADDLEVAQREPPQVSGHGGARPQTKSFASATAEATGQSKATTNRALARADALGDETLNAVVGTSLDKGVELDALSKMPPDERADLVRRAASGEVVTARKPEPAQKQTQTVDHITLARIRGMLDPELSAFLTYVEKSGVRSAVQLFLQVRLAA